MLNKLRIASIILLFMSLTAAGVNAQQKKPNILVIFGDDIGYSNISAYNLGMMGYQHAEHRPRSPTRRALHRLLRATELHGGPGGVHYWTKSVPYRAVESRAPWCRSWFARRGSYDC